MDYRSVTIKILMQARTLLFWSDLILSEITTIMKPCNDNIITWVTPHRLMAHLDRSLVAPLSPSQFVILNKFHWPWGA